MNAPPNWKLPTVLEMVPLHPFMLTRWEMVQWEWSSPCQPTASQDSHHVHDYAHPPSSVPPCFAGTISSKQIMPTDNMQPKSDDIKWHHRWLKCERLAFKLKFIANHIWSSSLVTWLTQYHRSGNFAVKIFLSITSTTKIKQSKYFLQRIITGRVKLQKWMICDPHKSS